MLKRLVVEFKDELEALGVKVAELDERVAVLEERLGGWHIHGALALDFVYQKNNEAPDGDSKFEYDDAKLFFERTWGEDDEYFFMARMENKAAAGVTTDRFYVEMPFFFDSRLTVGRFAWNWEKPYNISLPATGSWTGDSVMTNWVTDGFGFQKNFALGTFSAIFAHPGNGNAYKGILNSRVNNAWSAYMLALGFNMQFTEQIGLDIGAQAFFGDNAEPARNTLAAGDIAFDKLWTVWGGLRFNFNDNIGFKGIFYHQAMDTDTLDGTLRWNGTGYNRNGVDVNGNIVDDANHWALMLDVKQEALKYTSLWLEYGQYDQGFYVRSDNSIFYSPSLGDTQAPADIKYWRIALGQEWNDKWATHLFYYGYKNDVANGTKPKEFGLGVQYKLNDYTTMGLNYIHVDKDDNTDKDNLVRFRTSINF
jgi:hypothetical protein